MTLLHDYPATGSTTAWRVFQLENGSFADVTIWTGPLRLMITIGPIIEEYYDETGRWYVPGNGRNNRLEFAFATDDELRAAYDDPSPLILQTVL